MKQNFNPTFYFKHKISDQCTTPNQEAGVCINIRNCQFLITLLEKEGLKVKNYLKQSLCRYENNDPFVCCPKNSDRESKIEKENLYGPLLPPQCGFNNISHTRVVGGNPAKLGMHYKYYLIHIDLFLLNNLIIFIE